MINPAIVAWACFAKNYILHIYLEIGLNLNQSLFAREETLERQWTEGNSTFSTAGRRMSCLTVADYVDNRNHAENIHETENNPLNNGRVERNRDYSTRITPTRSNFAFIIFIILFIKSKINSHKNLWLLHVTSWTSLPFNFLSFSSPPPPLNARALENSIFPNSN